MISTTTANPMANSDAEAAHPHPGAGSRTRPGSVCRSAHLAAQGRADIGTSKNDRQTGQAASTADAIGQTQTERPIRAAEGLTASSMRSNPLPRHGGGLGRGKPRFRRRECSLAPPPRPAPTWGGGRKTACGKTPAPCSPRPGTATLGSELKLAFWGPVLRDHVHPDR
jgi:hypothetical protein